MVVLMAENKEIHELAATMIQVEIKENKENEINETEEVTEEKEDEADQIPAVRNTNKNLLAHFWNLASLDESARTDSVVSLIQELKKEGKEEDLTYTLQRLVKGLSSSRKAARQGFATALTHVMSDFSEISSETILQLIAKHLAVQGSFKGQEERDAYFGKVFGYLAIIRARMQSGDSEMDTKMVQIILDSLLALMKKKSYLYEICGTAICDIIQCMKYSTYEKLQPLEKTLSKGWEKCLPEDLMMALTVQSTFKNDLPEDYFKEHWNQVEILHESNFTHLSRVLMDTTNTAHPHVHKLWDIVLEHLFDHQGADDDTLEKFWKIIVEDGLMQSTHERKFLVMNLIIKIVPKISSIKVHLIFGESITRCIINSCQSKMNYLHNSAKNMLSKLAVAVSQNEDKEMVTCVIKALVGGHGHVGFDSITKTKAVEELTGKISNNLVEYFNWLKEVFDCGSTTLNGEKKEIAERDVNECRTWVANQLVSLLRSCKSENNLQLLVEITNFIFFHAYFVAVKKSKKVNVLKSIPVNAVSDSVQQVFKKRFNTALAELATLTHTKTPGEKSLGGGIAEDGEYYAWKVLCFGKKLLDMPKYATLSSAWTPEIYEAWNHSLEQITKMQTEAIGEEVHSHGSQLLFIHITLQLFSNREEAVDILKELETCFEKAQEKKLKKLTEPHWTEVLTEILLGFMAQSSHLMRQVVDLVYPTILPHLTDEAFNLLIKVIKPTKKNKEKDEDDIEFEDDSDVEEAEEAILEDIAEEKDVAEEKNAEEEINGCEETMEVEGEEEKNDEPTGDDSDSEDDSEDSEDDDSDFEVDEAFKAELKSALGDSVANSEEDDDGSELSDIDMDACDSTSLKVMDQALANVFKSREQRKIEKKKKKDRKVTILHFKLRVLDMIEIFIKKQPKDHKILHLLQPLYEVLEDSHRHPEEKPLFERTLGVVKNKLCNLHEYPCGDQLDTEGVHKQIETLIDLARTATSAQIVSYITMGTTYLIRVLRGSTEMKGPSPRRTRAQRKHKAVEVEKMLSVGSLDENRLIGCYKSALTEFMTKKSSHLQPILFNELIQRFPPLGWKLAVEIPQYINSGCNTFRKVKAVEMLKLLLSKKTGKIEDCLKEINQPLYTNIIQAFKSTTEETYSLKSQQFHDIVNLATLYVKEVSKYPKLLEDFDKDSIKASMTEALASPVVTRSTSLQSYCQNFLSTLNNEEKPPKKKKK